MKRFVNATGIKTEGNCFHIQVSFFLNFGQKFKKPNSSALELSQDTPWASPNFDIYILIVHNVISLWPPK